LSAATVDGSMNAAVVLRTLYLLALGLWVGAAVFFSAVVLPLLFTSMEPARAGEIAALVFPYYFRFGAALGALLLGTAIVIALRDRGVWRGVALAAAVMFGCQAYAAFVLHPEMAAIREIESERPRFDALHHRSVRLNGVVLIGGLALMLSSGWLLARR
jgi:hypothetical protein